QLQRCFLRNRKCWATTNDGEISCSGKDIALDQSSRAASARRLGNRSSASRSGRSEAQVPARLNKMATDATNVFVAATLNSCPAAIGKTIWQADARGLFVCHFRLRS